MRGPGVLLNMLAPLRSGYRHYIVTLREQPGKSDLRRGRAFEFPKRTKVFHKLKILDRVLTGDSRTDIAEVTLVEAFLGLDFARKEPAAKGGEGNDTYSKATRHRKYLRFEVMSPQRPFGLERRDLVNARRTFKRPRTRFTQTKMADLPLYY
jgi:hypothetical protein